MPHDALMQDPHVLRAIEQALDEDIGTGDATTLALVDPEVVTTAELQAREACRVAGVGVAQAVFERVDARLQCEALIDDGRDAAKDDVIMRISGPSAAILTGERLALNFMQRMTGIATMTRAFTEAVAGTGVMILDTRKTTPGLRSFEKYSVLCGGGSNHRMGLYDRVMIKDNHRFLWHDGDPTRLDLAVERARERFPRIEIEVEVENEAELRSALRAKPEWILLDNMSPERMRACVVITNGISKLEASGGITLETVRAAAESGVDAISLGCLTHSAPSVDLALEMAMPA
jgi:nicotinate-nucleotide pyrophosphorylase (carboxylating)